ncbi:MAG TPA: hypothetical protein VGN43_16000 [Steroidobacteraceae bacterium]|jgi:hypothetical protein|nr:hypothetical protein [Steroidobacteraceae bacterium]
MNTIQKAAFAASALVITVVGSALVTAPMAFARAMPVAAHTECLATTLQDTLSHQAGCTVVSRDAASAGGSSRLADLRPDVSR